MKAAFYEHFKAPIKIGSLSDPTVPVHGVILSVKATGVCRSDWHGWMGHDPDIQTFPHVPGHEFAGEIIEAGREVKRFRKGQRVTTPFINACGTCRECESGNHQVCDLQTQPGFTHWGSFAEYVLVDHADTNLIVLPENMNFTTAALLGCRFITSFRAIVDQGQVKPGQYVAIHGCGGVGLSAIMIAKALGAIVIAIDIQEEKLALASKHGADYTINAKTSKHLVEAIKDYTEGGVHASIDAIGNKDTCFNSIQSLRKRGKHIQVGLMAGQDALPVIPMGKVIAHELEIIGSHGMQAFRYNEMLEMISSGKLNPELLIGKTITLDEAPHHLESMNDFNQLGTTIINSF